MPEEEVLPAPIELKRLFPLSESRSAFIESSRQTVRSILNGEDKRILLIVGPCSIHHEEATLEFAEKLKKLSEDVSSHFFILMRFFYEKPRTKSGWKGLIYDPDMDHSHDIQSGLKKARHLLLNLADLKIPSASEFLDPLSAHYFNDLITWGCIGARTSESQIHRQLASGLNLPVSFKNSTSGNIEVAINGIIAAKQKQTFIGINQEGHVSLIKTKGNPDCHLTLRGSDSYPNYDPESISLALEGLEKAKLKKRVIIDCSHGNSKKIPLQQCHVFQSVIHQIIEGNSNIKGLILESELHFGNQAIQGNLKDLKYGVSVTDPCIDFQTTETLIRWAVEKFKKNINLSKETVDSCQNSF